MSAYTTFAQVYDYFMKEVPYDNWTDYIVRIMKRYGIEPKLVLDLGCGTGNITERLAHHGFEMIGIDNSEDMLNIALEKSKENKQDILYLKQDMREFELYGTVGCVVSVCDSINYIVDEQDLLDVFKLVNNYLDPGGLFIFDINTEYKFKHILSNNTFASSLDEGAYIWENYYYKEDKINEYTLSLFIKEHHDLYKKYEEIHYQKAYSVKQVKEILLEAGLEYVSSFNAFTFDPPTDKSERICFIARENQKEEDND